MYFSSLALSVEEIHCELIEPYDGARSKLPSSSGTAIFAVVLLKCLQVCWRFCGEVHASQPCSVFLA